LIFSITIYLLVILSRYLFWPWFFVLDKIRVKGFISDIRRVYRVERLCFGLESPTELEVVVLLHVVNGHGAWPPE